MLLVKNKKYCQLCTDYESKKFILKIIFFKKKNLKCSSYPFQLKAYYILLNSMQKVTFCNPWNTNWFKKYMSNCTLSFFLVPYQHAKLQLLPVSENRKFHRLALKFGGWPFGGWPSTFGGWPVTKHFGPKLGHSNERIYRKPVNRRLKTLLNKRSGSFLWPTTPALGKFF